MRFRIGLVGAAIVVSASSVVASAPWPIQAQGAGGSLTITTQQTQDGSALFTGDGKALYMFTFDTPGTATTPAKSNCTSACAGAWPPLLASGASGPFQATGDVQAAGLGTTQRSDGTSQVTYFGWPLYTFVADKAPGQTKGQRVANFEGLWYLLSPSGRPDPGVAMVTTESSPNGTVLSSPTAFSTYRSLYMLTADPPQVSTCTGGCARFWPPLLTSGQPAAGAGVNAAALGTIHRPDGTLQVTYSGTPLYFFAPDMPAGGKSGLTNGQDVVDPFNLGVWYLVSPRGAAQPGTATIGLKSTDLGSLLTYGAGATPVYAFSADAAGSSVCSGLCARIWTPVLTTGTPQAAAGSSVNAAALGTITRTDGTVQVTYYGKPLYLFSRDYTGTGGQGMVTFGGRFDLLQTSGSVSTMMPATRPLLAIPQVSTSGPGTSASFTVAFTSTAPGQGMVYFAAGSSCTGLVQVGTQDATAGTTTHIITVTGNDLPGTVGDIGIQAGMTYSYEVLTVSSSGVQMDNNNGKCYTVSIPSP